MFFIKLKVLKSSGIYKNNIKVDIHQLENCYIDMVLQCYIVWLNVDGFGLQLKPILIKANDSIYSESPEELEEVGELKFDELVQLQSNTVFNTTVDTPVESESQLESESQDMPSDIMESEYYIETLRKNLMDSMSDTSEDG